MGNKLSEEEKHEIDREKFTNNPRYIAWDEHGNLRYGMLHPVTREDQLREILTLDYVDNEDGKEWCLMDSAWVAAWLAYTHGDPNIAPAPGPCRNDRLIAWDYHEKQYKGRFGLFMAVKERAGDYRRVSMEVWNKFRELYPGSGPTIIMKYKAPEGSDTGLYDSSDWRILDPPPPPEDHETKKKKKKFFNKLRKNPRENPDGKDEDGEHKESEEAKEGTGRRGSFLSMLSQTKNQPKVDYNNNATTGEATAIDYNKVNTADTAEQRPSQVQQSRRESFFENVYFKD